METSLDEIYSRLQKELINNPPIRRIRMNPHFYQKLSNIVDEICDTIYGLDIIEDPSVETYEIE